MVQNQSLVGYTSYNLSARKLTYFILYNYVISCLRVNLIIVGDSNINCLNHNDIERRNLFHILEIFRLVEQIDLPTYKNDYLLDCIITM